MYRNATYAKYGYADEQMNLEFLNNTVASYKAKGDTRGESSFKRKNPRNFKEAFSADGEFALYDPEKLNNQLDVISWSFQFTERGNLEWVDGYRIKRPIHVNGVDDYEPSKVRWVADPNGKFEKIVGWMPREENKVYKGAGSFFPNRNQFGRIGCDPFKYDKTKDKRRSNCAAFYYQIPDQMFPDPKYDNAFCLRYAFREESTRAANEDILKMAWWCGCQVLFERNVNHWKQHFVDSECAGFLMWMPNEVEPGVITTGSGIQTVCDYTEAYINEHVNKVYFKSLLRKDTGWLGFKVEDTEKFDEPMGAGVTLIAVKHKTYLDRGANKTNVSDFFRKYK